MRLIKLTKGLFAKVDDELFEKLNVHKWHASGKSGKEYAARRMKDYEINPRGHIYMHQQIMNCIEDVDHFDGDRLNNQKYNLRPCTDAQNLQNTSLTKNQKGIGRDNTHNTWKAYFNVSDKFGTKRVNIGTYKTFDEAKKARDTYIQEYVCANN